MAPSGEAAPLFPMYIGTVRSTPEKDAYRKNLRFHERWPFIGCSVRSGRPTHTVAFLNQRVERGRSPRCTCFVVGRGMVPRP